MKLSIIVPIYNEEKYLSRCLDSLVKIPYRDMEILCIDDGSIDLSEEICKNYALMDRRFKVFKQENFGLPAVRNKALKIAKGDYISFVDSDDWVDCEMFEYFIQKMDTDLEIDICVSDTVRCYPDGLKRPMYYTESEQMFSGEEALCEMISNRIFFWYMWGKVYRRRVFEGFYADETILTSEDLDSNWQLFRINNIKKVWYSPLYKYYYFLNPASMTEGMKIFERRQSDLRVYTKILESNIYMKSVNVAYQMKIYALYALYDILRDLCFYNVEKSFLVDYVLQARNIIVSLNEVKDVDIEFVNKMKTLTKDVGKIQDYFLNIFQSVEKIIISIKEKQDIYIYGTGIVAKYVSAIFRKFRDYNGHIVSEGEPNIQKFENKQVFYLSQISKESTLLLAMNKSNQKLVTHNLIGRKQVIQLPFPDGF